MFPNRVEETNLSTSTTLSNSRARRNGYGVWFSIGVCLPVLLSIVWATQAREKDGKEELAVGERAEATLPELLSQGLPRGMALFHLDILRLTGPRLAILGREELRIFAANGSKLVKEFTLKAPPLEWHEMESFPSYGHLPGVVLWGGGESVREELTIVCYVKGTYKVVFTGLDASVVDLNLDGVPEVLIPISSSHAGSVLFQIWTWNGTEYSMFKTLPYNRIVSEEVLQALPRVEMPQGVLE